MEEQRKSENALVPALRFEGFSDPWEQRRLGEICDEVTRRNPLSEAPVMMITAESGFIEQSERYSTDNAGESLQKYIVLRRGELAYNHGASKLRPFGSCFNLLADEARIPFVYHCFSLRSDCPAFTSLELNGGQVEDQLRTLVSSGARMDGLLNISFEEYQTVRLLLPSLDEQRQIAGLFAKLDSLIALHQRKHEKLKTVKQSLLEKMFPKEGEDVPEIRFEGFTDPWEQRTFDEFVYASGSRNADNLDLESHSVSNTSGFVPQSEQFENGGTMAEADKTAYWIVEPGSFAYNPARINVGSIGYLATRENVIVSSLYEVFRSDETCDDRFLWHWLKSALFAKQIEALQEGGVRLYFFFDKLLKSEITMPSIREQSIIGSLFDWLDSLIALHQRELDILKNLKQALLEKMFV